MLKGTGPRSDDNKQLTQMQLNVLFLISLLFDLLHVQQSTIKDNVVIE